MNRLVWKIFIPVLVAMAGLIFVSLLLLVNFTSRINHNAHQQVPQLYEDAKDVLLDQGEAGMSRWLDENTNSIPGARIFIIDTDKKDILNRKLPQPHEFIVGSARKIRDQIEYADRQSSLRESRIQRRTGRYPFLRTRAGDRYTFILARPAGGFLGLLRSQAMFWPILFSMVLLSALVSALIARHISRPIQRLRTGAQNFSKGQLSERVSGELGDRHDEIGELARDFDVMAEKISGLMSTQQRLLRDVSHELRSPLARMQVALGLAEKRSGPGVKPDLERIETEANLLNEMIGKILSLVRLNNLSIDHSSLQWENLELVNMLTTLVANANYEGQEKNLTVHLHANGSVTTKAVPHLLSSALENVLRNALKYAPEHSQVHCEIVQTSGVITISIADLGPGVAQEELDKIFEPFYRASSVREHQQGTGGIGLAIAKRAVELHGGTITAKNGERGLVVEIVLPLT